METINSATSLRVPWNKGKLVGQKAPFKLKEIWAIRTAGTHIPYQIGKSNPSTPASAIVGTCGSKIERRAVMTPNGMRLPSQTFHFPKAAHGDGQERVRQETTNPRPH